MARRRMQRDSAAQRLSRQSLRLAEEVRHIRDRAAEHDGRIVGIGPLVLFSTDSGDAWILEPADHLATKLASDGDALPAYIEETETKFLIGWQGRFQIDGDTFIYENNESGRLVSIRGYPVKQLLRAIREAGGP